MEKDINDNLIKKPFIRYKLDEEKAKEKDKVFSIKLTPQDKNWFLKAKKYLKQPKNSTAMKQLALIGWLVLLEPKIKEINNILNGNVRRNEEIGISPGEYEKL